MGKNPVSDSRTGLKKPGFLPRLKMGIKYFGKNPVSDSRTGVKETGFFTEIKDGN
ncbi:MAG: hypothetical protein WBL95_21330 [Microcoleus sp.]